MNIKDYISSGIVEYYVLGLAEEAEKAEFERMCATHPEVKAARDAFEKSLEEKALINAVEPPIEIQSKIFAELNIGEIISSTKEPGEVVQMDTVKPLNWLRYLVAACIILLIGSTALNFYLFNQYKDYSTRYADLLASNSQIVSNSNAMEARLRSYESDIAFMKNPNVAVILISSLPTTVSSFT
ncbi:MAG: hypothetical protein WKF70_12425, partial [Chitinophagaceae bacterium]